eukprot:jgi/Chlat1/4171/Chrsp27S04271
MASASASASASSAVVRAASGLWDDVKAASARAQEQQAISTFETTTRTVQDAGVQFLVRVAAALKSKPEREPAQSSSSSKPEGGDDDGKEKKNAKQQRPNPFLPYDERMYVRDLPPQHVLLLNKFNVVPHHVLVVTKDFHHQTEPLTAEDFSATWQVLNAMPDGGFAFYNCGAASGHSQPHKHLQVVPFTPPLSPEEPDLPFLHAHADLPQSSSSVTGELLRETYARLYRESFNMQPAAPEEGQEDHVPSFNLLLTTRWMMLVPRSRDFDGPISVNALGFAGTFFVRSEDELEHVLSKGPMSILRNVGLPKRGE